MKPDASKHDPRPQTPAERVRRSESRKVEAGGRRLPGGVLSADASAALDKLQKSGYADSATACIARALIEADTRTSVTE